MSTGPSSVLDIPEEKIIEITEQVRAELKPILMKDITESNVVALAKFKDELRVNYELEFTKEIQKFRDEEQKKKTPLTNEEIQKLLSKEYVTFTVKLQNNKDQWQDFTLKELPQNIEMEMYSGAKKIVTDLVKTYNAISFKTLDGDLFQNIISLMELFDPIQNFLAKCCSLCLDPPRGKEGKRKEEWLTDEWVSENMSNYRIATIIVAQVEVSKMRDFFSILFQGFQDVAKKD